MPDLKAPAAALLALLALGACTPPGGTADGGPAAAGDDACGAAGLQTLVGTSVGTLDPATLPDPNRVIFPGQAVTMDFQAERVNVEIGPDDSVARVYCG
jgi:hypothetical protein